MIYKFLQVHTGVPVNATRCKILWDDWSLPMEILIGMICIQTKVWKMISLTTFWINNSDAIIIVIREQIIEKVVNWWIRCFSGFWYWNRFTRAVARVFHIIEWFKKLAVIDRCKLEHIFTTVYYCECSNNYYTKYDNLNFHATVTKTVTFQMNLYIAKRTYDWSFVITISFA